MIIKCGPAHLQFAPHRKTLCTMMLPSSKDLGPTRLRCRTRSGHTCLRAVSQLELFQGTTVGLAVELGVSCTRENVYRQVSKWCAFPAVERPRTRHWRTFCTAPKTHVCKCRKHATSESAALHPM